MKNRLMKEEVALADWQTKFPVSSRDTLIGGYDILYEAGNLVWRSANATNMLEESKNINVLKLSEEISDFLACNKTTGKIFDSWKVYISALFFKRFGMEKN